MDYKQQRGKEVCLNQVIFALIRIKARVKFLTLVFCWLGLPEQTGRPNVRFVSRFSFFSFSLFPFGFSSFLWLCWFSRLTFAFPFIGQPLYCSFPAMDSAWRKNKSKRYIDKATTMWKCLRDPIKRTEDKEAKSSTSLRNDLQLKQRRSAKANNERVSGGEHGIF